MGRGAVGKTAIIEMKYQETRQVIAPTAEETLQNFIDDPTNLDAKGYTDDASAYKGSRWPHQLVKHRATQYVRYFEGAVIHTNGVESFWSMLKRAHKGVYHRLWSKHLHALGYTFALRRTSRERDTQAKIQHVVAQLVGKRLMYRDLIAD